MTYSLAILRIPPATHAEIKARIDRVNRHGDYDHLFLDDGCIDMTHIAVQPDPADEVTPDYDRTEIVLSCMRAATGFPGDQVDLADAKLLIESLARCGYTIKRAV